MKSKCIMYVSYIWYQLILRSQIMPTNNDFACWNTIYCVAHQNIATRDDRGMAASYPVQNCSTNKGFSALEKGDPILVLNMSPHSWKISYETNWIVNFKTRWKQNTIRCKYETKPWYPPFIFVLTFQWYSESYKQYQNLIINVSFGVLII